MQQQDEECVETRRSLAVPPITPCRSPWSTPLPTLLSKLSPKRRPRSFQIGNPLSSSHAGDGLDPMRARVLVARLMLGGLCYEYCRIQFSPGAAGRRVPPISPQDFATNANPEQGLS